jgi:uncharacterized paraquat-inducible protein A
MCPGLPVLGLFDENQGLLGKLMLPFQQLIPINMNFSLIMVMFILMKPVMVDLLIILKGLNLTTISIFLPSILVEQRRLHLYKEIFLSIRYEILTTI